MQVRFIASAADGSLGYIEAAPTPPNHTRRVFRVCDDRKSLEYAFEKAFHTDGARARFYGFTAATTHDLEVI